MGRPGFEPGTNRLKAEYSTVELATPMRPVYSNTETHPNITWTGGARARLLSALIHIG